MAEILQAGCAFHDGIRADQYLETRDRTHGGDDEGRRRTSRLTKGLSILSFVENKYYLAGEAHA